MSWVSVGWAISQAIGVPYGQRSCLTQHVRPHPSFGSALPSGILPLARALCQLRSSSCFADSCTIVWQNSLWGHVFSVDVSKSIISFYFFLCLWCVSWGNLEVAPRPILQVLDHLRASPLFPRWRRLHCCFFLELLSPSFQMVFCYFNTSAILILLVMKMPSSLN